MRLPDDGTNEPRPAGPAAAGDPPPPAVAKASSGEVPPTASPAGGDGGEAVERDLEGLLAEAELKKDEYLELAQRTQADFENYRKRMAAEIQAAGTRGKAALVGELVHVLDNLERALDAAGSDAAGPPEAAKEALAHGVRLTYADILGAFKNHGVEVFDPKGEKFDPNQHEALSTVAVEGVEPGTVVEVMQKGYRFEQHLIRPARVVVSE